jgi:hypothetical protein
VAAQQPGDEHGEQPHDDREQKHQDTHSENSGTGPRPSWPWTKPRRRGSMAPRVDGWRSSRVVRANMGGRRERLVLAAQMPIRWASSSRW